MFWLMVQLYIFFGIGNNLLTEYWRFCCWEFKFNSHFSFFNYCSLFTVFYFLFQGACFPFFGHQFLKFQEHVPWRYFFNPLFWSFKRSLNQETHILQLCEFIFNHFFIIYFIPCLLFSLFETHLPGCGSLRLIFCFIFPFLFYIPFLKILFSGKFP